jgi:hypothetical protein
LPESSINKNPTLLVKPKHLFGKASRLRLILAIEISRMQIKVITIMKISEGKLV